MDKRRTSPAPQVNVVVAKWLAGLSPDYRMMVHSTLYMWHTSYMVKTTLYLQEETKKSISLLAQRRGVSEADVIRTALEHELSELRPDWDSLPVVDSPDLARIARDDETFLRESGFGSS